MLTTMGGRPRTKSFDEVYRDRLAVPDLAGWRVERVPHMPRDNPLGLIPDWCCEVLSPGTARDDRGLKLPMYASCGVSHVWLIDPDERTIEVYEARDARPLMVATARDDERPVLAPFGAAVPLASFWLLPEEPRVGTAP